MKTASRDIKEPDSDTGKTAAYLAEMAACLADVARRQGLETLGYLFDMAREEADNSARPLDGVRGRR